MFPKIFLILLFLLDILALIYVMGFIVSNDLFKKEIFKKDNFERVKIIVEILAVLIGGWWAYDNFTKVTEPTLASRVKAESTLKWAKSTEPNYVNAEFYVTLENMGTSRFSIEKARLRGWIFADSCPSPKEVIKYRDVNGIISGNCPIFCKTFIKPCTKGKEENDPDDNLVRPPFLGEYVENSVWSDNFEFTMKRNPTQHVLFLMEFYTNKNDKTPFEWTYHWTYIGGEDSSTTTPVDSKTRPATDPTKGDITIRNIKKIR
jgi:hypothetical protein